jgi:hypothetical protein
MRHVVLLSRRNFFAKVNKNKLNQNNSLVDQQNNSDTFPYDITITIVAG